MPPFEKDDHAMTQSAVICGYLRTPFTLATKGALASVRPDDLLAHAIRGLIAKTGVKPEAIEDVIVGNAFPEGEQGFNIGRMVALLADLPLSAPGATINRWCGSSMEAIHIAAGKIATGAGEVFLCAGVESMSRVPMGGYNPMPNPELYGKMPEAYMNMGETAEVVAERLSISRKDQEAFAIASHQKAANARAALAEEIIPIVTPDGIEVVEDGIIRADSDPAKLATLPTVFKANGTVTAATSSPLTDGAAVVLVCSEAYADANGLPKLARIKSSAVVGLEPEIMGLGPVAATQKALARAGLTLEQIDFIELNEAFAAQSLGCIKQLGVDAAKVNIEGGAIALGHPLGASGARITGKAAHLLKKTGKKYAVATACIGGGMGIATVLEAI
jgi:acetyl-CoA acyltransferase